jgi:copper(I)-binding protein
MIKATALALLFIASFSLANAGELMVEQAWARATPGKAANGAAYVSVVNHGAKDTLIGVESEVAKKTEIHTHTKKDGVMKMGPAGPVELEPGATVTFQPGGLHIMFMKLKAPLKEGEMVAFTLIFEKAGKRPVMAKIMPVGAAGPEMDHKSGHQMKKSD